MNLPYQARKLLKRLGIGLLVLLLLCAGIWFCWVIFAQRYVVYTRDGVVLDFHRSSEDLTGELAREPAPGETIGIHFNEETAPTEPDHSLGQLSGWYADGDALSQDMDTVKERLSELAPGTPVLVDVKNGYGSFFYHSSISGAEVSDSVDADAMDDLIATLRTGDFYAIARVPAFRDRSFCLDHVESGLPAKVMSDSGYLWADEEGCYWLDPAAGGTVTNLIQIANELRKLGFDEVVFTDFRFPPMEEIDYENKTPPEQILQETAKDLVDSCATATFAVSFQTDDPGLVLPKGRTRMYLAGVDASMADQTAALASVSDKAVNLVFLALTNDTRYNPYGALHSFLAPQVPESTDPDPTEPEDVTDAPTEEATDAPTEEVTDPPEQETDENTGDDSGADTDEASEADTGEDAGEDSGDASETDPPLDPAQGVG